MAWNVVDQMLWWVFFSSILSRGHWNAIGHMPIDLLKQHWRLSSEIHTNKYKIRKKIVKCEHPDLREREKLRISTGTNGSTYREVHISYMSYEAWLWVWHITLCFIATSTNPQPTYFVKNVDWWLRRLYQMYLLLSVTSLTFFLCHRCVHSTYTHT